MSSATGNTPVVDAAIAIKEDVIREIMKNE
jgi:hypothetical protein